MHGGGFNDGDIDNLALESIKSYKQNEDHHLDLQGILKEIERPGTKNTNVAPDYFAPDRLNNDYKLLDNSLGLASIGFQHINNKYFIIIKRSDGSKEEHPVGMDNQYAISNEHTFGLPVAVKGYWVNANTLLIDYNELSRIQDYSFRISFMGDSIRLAIHESTMGIDETIAGNVIK